MLNPSSDHFAMTNSALSWQQQLKDGFSQVEDLLRYLNLDVNLLSEANLASQAFALRVPRCFANRMQKGDIHDPLLKQVLPLGLELLATPGFVADPLKEQAANPMPGLLHKYQGRVLFIVSGACAINCRYCFRRHFPYTDNNPGKVGWDKVLQHITEDASIEEVILSGGDPLVVNDKQFAYLVARISAIAHIKRLRIHTRLPIVLPARISQELLDTLAESRLNVVCVVHSNHANEIDAEVRTALMRLKAANVYLLNQAVLLRGINDSVVAQHNLHSTLFQAGVLPYYLHLLDPVAGAAHFDVPEKEAIALMQQLQASLPGYLVPRLVREVPGEDSKSIVAF